MPEVYWRSLERLTQRQLRHLLKCIRVVREKYYQQNSQTTSEQQENPCILRYARDQTYFIRQWCSHVVCLRQISEPWGNSNAKILLVRDSYVLKIIFATRNQRTPPRQAL